MDHGCFGGEGAVVPEKEGQEKDQHIVEHKGKTNPIAVGLESERGLNFVTSHNQWGIKGQQSFKGQRAQLRYNPEGTGAALGEKAYKQCMDIQHGNSNLKSA